MSVGLLGGTVLHTKIVVGILPVLITAMLSIGSQLTPNTENKFSHSTAILQLYLEGKI